jgi:hypothetical protein
MIFRVTNKYSDSHKDVQKAVRATFIWRAAVRGTPPKALWSLTTNPDAYEHILENTRILRTTNVLHTPQNICKTILLLFGSYLNLVA